MCDKVKLYKKKFDWPLVLFVSHPRGKRLSFRFYNWNISRVLRYLHMQLTTTNTWLNDSDCHWSHSTMKGIQCCCSDFPKLKVCLYDCTDQKSNNHVVIKYFHWSVIELDFTSESFSASMHTAIFWFQRRSYSSDFYTPIFIVPECLALYAPNLGQRVPVPETLSTLPKQFVYLYKWHESSFCT